ncbi:MAG: SprB repeat-containing protein, partial [Bacteroidetes bacterium]|nr:SprB repeat-containing protein [Bacteroidota bacterium]
MQIANGQVLTDMTGASASVTADQALQDQVKKTLRQNAEALRFIENKGQISDKDVLYYFQGKNGSAYIERNKIRFVANELSEDGHSLLSTHAFTLSLPGSTPTGKMQLGDEFATTYNFFFGTSSDQGVTGVKAAKDLTFENIYPGIDLRLYSSSDGFLEFDWILDAGADFGKVNMHFEGQDKLIIDQDGSLTVGLRFMDVKFHIPESYQVTEKGKTAVNISFTRASNNTISFTANSEIDSRYPLVIDPVLSWGTWFDGNSTSFDDYLFAIQVDSLDGKVYCAGNTKIQIATNSAPYDANGYLNTVANLNSSGGVSLSKAVAVVYRISANGNDLEEMTLYGPSDIGTTSTNEVSAYALALSPNRVFIGGYVNGVNIPTAGTPFDNARTGNSDGFVAVLSRDLGTLNYATYLGSSGDETRGVTSIRTIDDNTFIVGLTAAAALSTSSPNYISGAAQSSFGGGSDMYIAKFTSLNTLAWGTYAGGTGTDVFNDLHILPNGNVAFCGYTSGSFPETNSAAASGSLEDGVIGVLNNTGSSFIYKDQIGGSNNDRINAIEYVNDTLYWTGLAGSGFPASASGVYDNSYNGGNSDAVVGKVRAAGGTGSNNTGGYAATFYGTSGNDLGNGIKLVTQSSCDGSTTTTFLLVFGTVGGSGLPTLNINSETFYNSSFTSGGNVGLDMFFAGFTSNLVTLKYATYMGGNADDYLGSTGDPRGANHLWVNGANVYLGTTSHSASHSPTLISGGFDVSKSNSNNDAHIILGIQFASILASDYSDAPSSYGTPAHILTNCNSLHIGLLIDSESGSSPTTDANGDDLSGSDDEDGISTLPILTDGSGQNFSVTVNNIVNSYGATANLYGWIDFNGDGQFSSGEFASTTVASGYSGSKTLSWTGVTVSGSAGSHYVRIRLTTDNLTDNGGTSSVDERSTVQASNGEIEDYRCISITCPAPQSIVPCATQATVNSAYATWLASAKAGGGYNGVLTNNSPGTPSVSSPGTYTVTFTYTYTCTPPASCGNLTTNCSSTFTIQPASNITVTPTVLSQIACHGGTGQVKIEASGGTAPYTGTGTFTQSAGSHVYSVTDANGCSNSVEVTLTEPAVLTCTVTKNSDVKCNGQSNGSATVNPTGGNGGYSYAWDNGETTATATGLNAGTHNVTVTDNKGCTTSCSVLIGQPQPLTCT